MSVSQVFSPAKVIFAGIGVLFLVRTFHDSPAETILTPQILQATKDVSTSQNNLVELLSRIEYFFRRLEIYTTVPPTILMMEIIVEIMVKVITILGIATEELQRGRLSELILCRFATLD